MNRGWNSKEVFPDGGGRSMKSNAIGELGGKKESRLALVLFGCVALP